MKAFAAFAAAMLLTTATMAQQVPEKTFTLTLTVPELQVTVDALNDLPYKKASPVIEKITAQFQAQNASPKKPEDPKKD